MRIKVQLFGSFRQLTGNKEAVYDIKESSNLGELISFLIGLYGKSFKDEMDRTPGLRMLVNGQENAILGGMDVILKEADTVVILPPVVGG